MTYQLINLIYILILVLILSLVSFFGKSESSFSSILFTFFSIGCGLTLLGLGVSWLVSGAPILEVATFQKYQTTLGYIRVYGAGLAVLLTIPILIIGKLIYKILGKKNNG